MFNVPFISMSSAKKPKIVDGYLWYYFRLMLLLLDISCENIFALSVVTALLACPFSIKKCAKASVFYAKTVKIRWRLGATPPDPFSLRRLGVLPPDPRLRPPPLPNPGCATGSMTKKLCGQLAH